MPQSTQTLPWFAPCQEKERIFPVFLPFSGCSVRCIFCAQEVQTAQKAPVDNSALEAILSQTHREIMRYADTFSSTLSLKKQLPSLAFYGGTFTAIPMHWRERCLNFAHSLMQSGLIRSFRCSTRPDYITPDILETLQVSGCHTVELGIQSFATQALHSVRRYYTQEDALHACTLIKDAGLRLGVQLMPAMPGTCAQDFLQDIRLALELGADFLRFYPCLVIENTELARMWQEKKYTPWSLEETIQTLAEGWLLTLQSQTPVIRMGLAPEKNLVDAILAGPFHPALGALVQAHALYHYIIEATHRQRITFLSLPKRCQGFFWGEKRSLAPLWEQIGVTQATVQWHEHDEIYFSLD